MTKFDAFSWSNAAYFGAYVLAASMLTAGCGSTGEATTSGDADSRSEATASEVRLESASEDSTSVDSASTGPETGESDVKAEPVRVLRTDQIRDKIEDVAESWYGVPYEWSGESKDGIDCSAFVQRVYQQAFSYRLPRVTETQVQTGSKVDRSRVRPGDLVFFQPEGEWNHVGVYLGDGTFAHASSSDGVTEANFDKSYWQRFYWTARRPLKPSVVPDSLESELVAYRYPADGAEARSEADTTGGVASQQNREEKPKATRKESPESETITIASCSNPDIDCADRALSEAKSEAGGSETVAVADTTTRKGW